MKLLEQYHRPIICTEFMARNIGSTFDTILPLAKKYHVGAINWGLVAGKSQTWIPWDSWQRPYVTDQPTLWQHDVFHPDGKPYREREAEIIRSLTAAENRQFYCCLQRCADPTLLGMDSTGRRSFLKQGCNARRRFFSQQPVSSGACRRVSFGWAQGSRTSVPSLPRRTKTTGA